MSHSFPIASCFVCGAAVVLAGCGGSSHKASTTRTSEATSTAPAASNTPTGLQRRLIVGNELAGFTPTDTTAYKGARQWQLSPNDQQAPDQTAAEKAMLAREGFQASAVENLSGPAPDEGLSVVEQFRSPGAARDALAFYISQQKEPEVQSAEGKYAAFNVPGVPGAEGYTLGGASGGSNIAFAQGDYYLLIGREGGSPADIAGLSAAARRLYDRARG